MIPIVLLVTSRALGFIRTMLLLAFIAIYFKITIAFGDSAYSEIRFSTWLHFEGMAFGAIAAACAPNLKRDGMKAVIGVVLIAMGISLYIITFNIQVSNPILLVVPMLLLSSGTALCLRRLSMCPSINCRWLTFSVSWLAKMSYCIYLLHLEAILYFDPGSGASGAVITLSIVKVLFCTIGMAWLMLQIIEKPALGLRDRMFSAAILQKPTDQGDRS